MTGVEREGPLASRRAETTNEPSDHWLLRQFQHGSQDAAVKLYARYADRLRALARAECSPVLARFVEADDIVQSVFWSFFRRARRGYYNVPTGGELWQLFLVITLNKIRAKAEFHHAAKRDVRLTATGLALDRCLTSKAERETPARDFLQTVIDDIMASLPPKKRRMIELLIQGYEVAEIASQTQRSKRTVERVLQEFRNNLKTILDESK